MGYDGQATTYGYTGKLIGMGYYAGRPSVRLLAQHRSCWVGAWTDRLGHINLRIGRGYLAEENLWASRQDPIRRWVIRTGSRWWVR